MDTARRRSVHDGLAFAADYRPGKFPFIPRATALEVTRACLRAIGAIGDFLDHLEVTRACLRYFGFTDPHGNYLQACQIP